MDRLELPTGHGGPLSWEDSWCPLRFPDLQASLIPESDEGEEICSESD